MTSAISSMFYGSSESLESQMKTMIETMKKLNQSVDTMSETVRGQTATINDLNARVAAQSAQLNTQTATIANLEGRVKAQTREIATLKSQLGIQAKKSEISDLKIQNLLNASWLKRIFFSWERLMMQDNVDFASGELEELERKAKAEVADQENTEKPFPNKASITAALVAQADKSSTREGEQQVAALRESLHVDSIQGFDFCEVTSGDVQLTANGK